MIEDRYTAAPQVRGKTNRAAIASQRCAAEDRAQRVLLGLIGLVLLGAVVAIACGATALVVSWLTLALVLGLALVFHWRARIVSRLEPYARTRGKS